MIPGMVRFIAGRSASSSGRLATSRPTSHPGPTHSPASGYGNLPRAASKLLDWHADEADEADFVLICGNLRQSAFYFST
jgi:hypothetical protein